MTLHLELPLLFLSLILAARWWQRRGRPGLSRRRLLRAARRERDRRNAVRRLRASLVTCRAAMADCRRALARTTRPGSRLGLGLELHDWLGLEDDLERAIRSLEALKGGAA